MKDGTPKPISREAITGPLSPFLGSVPLTDSQLQAINVYIDLLLKWNAKLNLTAIRDRHEIIIRHFGESLFSARHLFPAGNANESVIDIGSGAGFPGLPLKIWASNLDLALIESNQRKATFLREVIRALELKSAVVVTERAETVSLRADVVTLRAVEHFERILPIAFGMIKPSGRIALLVGEAQVRIAEAAGSAISWSEPLAIPLSRNARLLIGQVRVS